MCACVRAAAAYFCPSSLRWQTLRDTYAAINNAVHKEYKMEVKRQKEGHSRSESCLSHQLTASKQNLKQKAGRQGTKVSAQGRLAGPTPLYSCSLFSNL